MAFFHTLRWFAAGVAVTPLVEYAWHAWIGHGKRADPSHDTHLEHHKSASRPVETWKEMGENAPRIGGALVALNAALAPLVGWGRSVPFSAGLAAGYVCTTLYHARMHRRAPRTRY